MNNLSETKVYNRLLKIYGEIPRTIQTTDMSKYLVHPSFYNTILENFKDYKYPMARKVYEETKKGSVLPIMLACPINEKDPIMVNKIPQTLLTFGSPDPITRKLNFYVDTSTRSNYVRNKIDKTPESYKIDPSDFYAFMQIGIVYKAIKTQVNKFTAAKILHKSLSECYGIILSKVIDQKLSFSANREDYNILLFLCIQFYYEALVGLSKSSALEKSKQFKFLFKDVLDMKCKYIRNDLNMQYSKEEAEKDIYPIDKFISVLQDQFSTLGDKINYRDLLSWYTNMYGQNAVLAIEDSCSFIQMMQLVDLKCNFYKDLLIEQAIKKSLTEVPKILAQIID